MALFGLLGGDKVTPKNIEKQVQKVKERYAQPEFRRAAMEKLLEWGTLEALEGLLKRFTVVAQSPHWDEDEKRWLVDELAERGGLAKQALREFLAKENHIAFAAKALSRLCTEDEFATELLSALHAHSPEDHRTVQGKQELVAAIGELGHLGALEGILPYLDDHGDDVQCTAIDVVERCTYANGYHKLKDIVTEDHRSARVLRHAAGAISRLKIAIDPQKPLAPAVIEDYLVKDGTLASNRT
jgi:hypothetical protein